MGRMSLTDCGHEGAESERYVAPVRLPHWPQLGVDDSRTGHGSAGLRICYRFASARGSRSLVRP